MTAAARTRAGDVRSAKPSAAGGQPATKPLVEGTDVLLLDLDGTVYLGATILDSAVRAVRECGRRGVRTVYVTNNPSRRPADIAAQLDRGGIPASAGDVVTSAQAGARLLASLVPAGTRTLVVGSDHLREEVVAAGLSQVATSAPVEQLRSVGAVVQGFDPGLGWRDLAAAAYALAGDAVWVATNTDLSIPTAEGVAPGNGSLVEAVARAVHRSPQVAGKPFRPLVDAAVERTGATAPLVVGDRLDTDIGAGVRAGLATVLVLTGVAGPADLLAADPELRPTHLAADLGGLLEPALRAAQDGTGWRCGGWVVRAAAGRIEVDGAGDRVAGLWALAHAVWHRRDHGGADGGVDSGPDVGADGGPDPAAVQDALSRLGWGRR